jgi:hypothetical protein
MKRSKPTITDYAVRRDDLREEIIDVRAERRRVDVRLAKLFREVDRSAHFVYEACSSVRQFGEKHGFSSMEAATYAAAGVALEVRPDLEEKLLAGAVTLDGVALLASILGDPALLRDGDDWIGAAMRLPHRDLRRKVRERIVEVREGGPPSRLDLVVSSCAREKFERARQIASRKKRKALSEGETVEVLSDHYLDSFDPARKKGRKRRMPDTNGRPGRKVSAAVKRKLSANGDGCQFPGCDCEIFVEIAHLKPHSEGGSREAENLRALCHVHHVLQEAGWIRAEGTAEEPIFFERMMTEFGVVGWVKVENARAPPG